MTTIKNIDLHDKKYHKRVIDLGCAATNLLARNQRIDEIDEVVVYQFRKDCKRFILRMEEKLSERLIVGAMLVKAASSLNPSSIGRGNVDSLNGKFRRLVQEASGKLIITDDVRDKATAEYYQIITPEAKTVMCREFKLNEEQRLDDFLQL